jgi:hypothetical protein
MEGRGGGGGRSSGKGSAGKIMSLQEFVSSMAPLIDLEKVCLSGSFSRLRRLPRSEGGMDCDDGVRFNVRRRRRFRRNRRRAPKGWRGEGPSCPTSSAPMPRFGGLAPLLT